MDRRDRLSGDTRGKNQSVTPRKASDGAWRSPVAHLLWEQGVPSSNLGAPTEFFEKEFVSGIFFLYFDRYQVGFFTPIDVRF